ncbi:MAG: hypothetical protein JKX80_02055 [Candidatus Pacebacteria bacterium]|nr:hypothetical protein [Candidatus Paceibacterota bacterium]
MQSYKDTDNDSNIEAYEYDENSITIRFKDNSEYEYIGDSVSFYVLNQMKALADAGDGLNAFINENRPPYSSKR